MQVNSLHKEFDRLQTLYGDSSLNAIYGAGCTNNPKICFVFMNPTSKNIASEKTWEGLRAPWLSTKNTWKLLNSLRLLKADLYEEIEKRKRSEWEPVFAQRVYEEIKNNGLYLTNLAKCTQIDAKHLSNKVFKEYLGLLETEIDIIKPQCIITFGNQVSSVFMDQQIHVSTCRQIRLEKNILGKMYPTYAVYYPVGQGMRNINKSIEDITKIRDLYCV